MQLRRDFLVGLGVLLTLNLLLALGAIGLLTRMSPAIREIIEENVASLEASEVMLAVLVPGEADGYGFEDRQRFQDSLERAKRNITEESEGPVLARIERLAAEAFDGNRGALARLEDEIVELADINKRAMVEADSEARRLGVAGAWIAAFCALASLLIGLFVINRLDQRLVEPLIELDQLLSSLKKGETTRRFTLARAPVEVRRNFEVLNRILDERFVAEDETGTRKSSSSDSTDLNRAALNYFLGIHGRLAVILNRDGEPEASNEEALVRFSEPEGPELRAQLEGIAGGEEPSRFEVVPLGELGWFCVEKRTVR